MSDRYHLVLACPDGLGIVANVSGLISEYDGFIIDADQHSDDVTGWFFMRYVLDLSDLNIEVDEFYQELDDLCIELEMRIIQFRSLQQKPRLVLMASKEAHCLEDILYRWRCEDLSVDLLGVISNHEVLKERVQWYDLPYYYVPMDKADKTAHFSEVEKILADLQPDIIGLARYMQILPRSICDLYPEQIINIHHSFLPSFKGSKPYHQAFHKGVKLIGATAHYVTPELDQGPIIDQDVVRINHRHSIRDCQQLGCDVERLVFMRAIQAHAQDRVIVHEGKTVVFNF